MLISYHRGQTSVVLRVKILDSTATTGAGKTGLTSSSTGLIISTIADNEATATAYTVAGSTIESITTLGTYAAPTATKCRFKEVDSTNHKGVYEIQIADARFAVSSAKSLLVSISGATGAAETDAVIPLVDEDPYNAVTGGHTALPNTACTTNASLLTSGTGTDQISVSAGKVLLQATQTGVTIPTVTTVTNQLTAAQIATGVWQDATSGDFTVSSSIGKSLYTSGAVPGAAGGLFIAGTNAATTITTALTTTFTGNLTGSVGSVTGAVGSISGVTFPTNFSALAIAATTGQVGIDWSNIKAPTTTVNLSGTTISTSQAVASVSGSVGSVTGAVGSVTGNVGGNVTGSVGSISGVTFPSNFGSLVIAGAGYVNSNTVRRLGRDISLPDGTLASATSSTITLPATDADGNTVPNDGRLAGKRIFLSANTGVGEEVTLSSWVSGRQYNVSPSFVVTPDNTSQYKFIPGGGSGSGGTVTGYATGQDPATLVWGATRSSFTTSGSFGQGVASVQGNVTGSVASVTGAVGSISGVTFPTGFGSLIIDGTTHYLKVDVEAVAGVAEPGYFAQLAGGTSSTVTFPATDAYGTTIDPAAQVGKTFDIVAGTAAGYSFTVTSVASGSTVNVTFIGTPGSNPNSTSKVSPGYFAGSGGGSDTPGTTTLLSRLTSTRATNLDNLDAAVSTRSTYAGGAVASVTGNVGGNVVGSVASVTAPVTAGTVTDKTGYSLNLAQSLSTSPTTGTLGHALSAALGNAVGKVVQSGTTLTLYFHDNSTVLRTFTLDSSTSPTQRT